MMGSKRLLLLSSQALEAVFLAYKPIILFSMEIGPVGAPEVIKTS